MDSRIEADWRKFRAALADAMAAMEDGGFMQAAVDPAEDLDVGAPPQVCVRRCGNSVVVEVPSNRQLATAWRLAKPARRHLHALGFAKPTKASRNYYRATYPASHVDQAASVAVSALRVAFGVVHPAFLHSRAFQWETQSHLPSPDALPTANAAAVRPVDREHLDLLVEQALTALLGHTPERDSDGDFPIAAGSGVVFVRSQVHSPSVWLFANMVVAIEDTDAALLEVDALNHGDGGVKFALYGDTLVASATLMAMPFLAEHLQVLVADMCDVVSGHDKALARRLGGQVYSLQPEATCVDGEPSAHEDMHPVMRCLLELDADRPGSVRPKVAARLCGYDSALILDLIRWNEEQEIAWREARDEAVATDHYDDAELCEIERAHAQRTVKVLRKALRRVLLGEAA